MDFVVKIVPVTLVLLIMLVVGVGYSYHQGRNKMSSVAQMDIGVSLTPLSAPFYVAKKEGFFEQNGLDVNVVPCLGGVNCAALLQKDIVDYATTSGTVALFNSYTYNNVALLASFVKSSNDVKLLSLEPLGITNLSDLAGKRVGVIKSSASEYYFDLLLISRALQDLDVERVYLEPDEMVSALLSYQVDAISIWEPYGYLASLVSAAPVTNLGKAGLYQLSFNLLAKTSRKASLDTDVALLTALSHAIEWILAHPSETVDMIEKELGIHQQQVDWAWDDYVFRLSNDHTLLSNLQLQARWASKRGILQGDPIDVRRFVDDSAYLVFSQGVASR